ncbi:MAG TPA: nuclear transport factor 2 family protein [Luteitalea sp.]|nr:nuclear transport factor 2 family protein [Luteitalea sp.]
MVEDSRGEVLALLRAQEDATARGDAAGVVALMVSDIVTYDLPAPLQFRGAGAPAVEGLNQWFATWDGPVTVELDNPTVIIEGDIAVVYGLSRMRGRKRGVGAIDSWNRRTVVLRRSDGAWRIVHERSSYPMEMDGSGRAATDLQP